MKNLLQIAILILTFASLSQITNAQFGGGAGGQFNPYQISTREHLEELADSVANSPLNDAILDYNWSRGKYFILMNDITDSVRSVIGQPTFDSVLRYRLDAFYYLAVNEYYSYLSFQGNFNGNGNKITLAINIPDEYYIGLFGAISKANIFNLSVDGYVYGIRCVGGIIGSAFESEINNCTNYANIKGEYLVGGVVGAFEIYRLRKQNSNSYISNCVNYGYISGNSARYISFIGGIVGGCTASNFVTRHSVVITDNTNYGDVKGDEVVGGIVGCANLNGAIPKAIISNCGNSGNIVGDSSVGGITGHFHQNVEISNSINIGTITASIYVSGIAGGGSRDLSSNSRYEILVGPTDVFNCINSGLIIGELYVGGILGHPENSGEIRKCINTGVIIYNYYANNYNKVGGIVSSVGTILDLQNNHYDKQMCIYRGVNDRDIGGEAEGYLTKAMIGTGLQDKLGNVDWVYSDNLYPTLRVLQTHPIALIARSPAYLDDENKMQHVNDYKLHGYDVHCNIRKCFSVNIENNIVWTKTFDKVNITPKDTIYDVVLLEKLDNDIIYSGIYINWKYVKKTVPITITDISKPCDLLPYIFNLVLIENPTGSATLIGAGEYEEGKIAIYQAVPNACYTFINWTDSTTGDTVSTKLIDTILMDKDYTLIANFRRDYLELITKANPEAGGTTIGAGIFNCNEYAIYQAVPNACYTFINWIDSITGDAISTKLIDTILMDKDYTLIANFEEIKYILDVSSAGNGSVNPDGKSIRYCDEIVEITAEPYNCYIFKEWVDKNNKFISNDNPLDVTMISDSTLIATFENAEVFITIRWDSVINITPNDTISFTATIENINRQFIFDSIYFNIAMDYKLFIPYKLFVINGNIEYPINFDFTFNKGIDAAIGYQEFKTGARFLRLEGMTLLSLPTSTSIFFDKNKFDIINAQQCNNLTFEEGFLDVSNFCGSEWRGAIIFLPEFNAEIEDIVTDVLNIEFNATGKLDLDIDIIDIDGNTIYSQKHILEKGNTNKEIKLNAIATGKYFVRFANPFNKTITKMFIIRR